MILDSLKRWAHSLTGRMGTRPTGSTARKRMFPSALVNWHDEEVVNGSVLSVEKAVYIQAQDRNTLALAIDFLTRDMDSHSATDQVTLGIAERLDLLPMPEDQWSFTTREPRTPDSPSRTIRGS